MLTDQCLWSGVEVSRDLISFGTRGFWYNWDKGNDSRDLNESSAVLWHNLGSLMADARRVGDGRGNRSLSGNLVTAETKSVVDTGETSDTVVCGETSNVLFAATGSLPELQIPETAVSELFPTTETETTRIREGSDQQIESVTDGLEAGVEQGEIAGMEDEFQNSDFNDDLLAERDTNQIGEGLIEGDSYMEEEIGEGSFEMELGEKELVVNGSEGSDLAGVEGEETMVSEDVEDKTINNGKAVRVPRGHGGTKKSVTKPPLVLPANSSRKRNLNMVSPRRKQAPRIGEGLYPGKPGDGPGSKGGNVPPKKVV